MKRYLTYFVTSILVVEVSLSSCEQYSESNSLTDRQVIVLTGEIVQNDARTKTMGDISTLWIINDKIGVFSPQAVDETNNPAINEPFTAIVSSWAERAAFDGKMYWGEGSHDFYGYYPYREGNISHENVSIALPSEQHQDRGVADDFGPYDFMVATPLTNIQPNVELSAADINLSFNHVFALIRIDMVGSGHLTKVKLQTENERDILAFEDGVIDISQPLPNEGRPYIVSHKGQTSNSVILNLTEPARLGNDIATTSAHAFMLINPIDLRDKKITITATIDGEEKSVSGIGMQFRRGYRYSFMVDMENKTEIGDKLTIIEESIDPNSTLAEYKISSEQHSRLTNDLLYYIELEAITQDVYAQFNDDFDFIFYLMDNPARGIGTLSFTGVNQPVSNSNLGLGHNLFNYASYGSQGKLKSIIYFPIYDAIHNGPALHEMLHYWGAFVCQTYDQNGIPIEESTVRQGHWGVSNAGGQLGGFKYVRTVEENSGGELGKTLYQAAFSSDEKASDGSFIAGGFGINANGGGNGPAYSDIELYLMGMKSAEELRNENFRLDVYTGCSSDPETFGAGYFWATGITSYTIDDLIALNGPRDPDTSTAQKHFKVLTVVLTPEDVTEHHYADIIKGVSWLAGEMGDNSYPGWGIKNFREATGGRGSLEVTGIKNSLKQATPATRGTQSPIIRINEIPEGIRILEDGVNEKLRP